MFTSSLARTALPATLGEPDTISKNVSLEETETLREMKRSVSNLLNDLHATFVSSSIRHYLQLDKSFQRWYDVSRSVRLVTVDGMTRHFETCRTVPRGV